MEEKKESFESEDVEEASDEDVEKPEVIPKEKAIQKREQKPLAETMSRPSRIPLFNRLQKKRIESFTEVVRAENNLMDALVGHTKTKSKLADIDIEIEGDRIERRLRLKGLKREEKGADQDDEIAELDRKITIAEKRKRLAEFEGSMPTAKTKTAEELAEERISNLTKQQRYKAREQAVNLFGQFETRKEIEREAERRKNEILKGRKPEQLSEEEREYIEDIDDAKSYALGRM